MAQRLDSAGGVVSASAYDAYGSESSTTAVADPWGYNGKWGYVTDRETGLCYCRHRYYDPQNGRWLTRDPIGFEGGVNLYGYCGGGPVGRRDPSGLQPGGPGVSALRGKVRRIVRFRAEESLSITRRYSLSKGERRPANDRKK